MITQNFFVCFSIGFFASLQFGQSSFYIFQKSMERGFFLGMTAVAGFCLAETGYLFLSLSGSAVIFQKLIPEIYLWVLGGITLLFAGYQGIRSSINSFHPRQNVKKGGNVFVTGFLLTAVHPINLFWWIGVLSPLIIADMLKNSWFIAAIDGSGVIFGELLVLSVVVFATSRLRANVSNDIAFRMTKIAAFILILFSFWFFYKAFSMY